MDKKRIALLFNVLIAISALTTVIGAILKIVHNPGDKLIFVIGILSFLLVMALKRILKEKRNY